MAILPRVFHLHQKTHYSISRQQDLLKVTLVSLFTVKMNVSYNILKLSLMIASTILTYRKHQV